MANAMKANIAFCPLDIGFLRSRREMLDPGHLANLFQEFHGSYSPCGFCPAKSALDGRRKCCAQEPRRPSNPFSSAHVI